MRMYRSMVIPEAVHKLACAFTSWVFTLTHDGTTYVKARDSMIVPTAAGISPLLDATGRGAGLLAGSPR
jgi:hypothetical protein